MAFDPRTAYADEWQWMHCVDDGRLERRTAGNTLTTWCDVKVTLLDMSTPNYIAIAAALMATADTNLFHLWPQDLADGAEADPAYGVTKPEIGDVLIIDDVVWRITSATERRFGAQFTVAATKAVYATP